MKLNRKINAFGKSIPVIAIILMVLTAGIAGAVLVPYLSNPITADVTVESPIVQTISLDEEIWADTLTLELAYGGEPITFYTRETNMANADITGFSRNTITCLQGVSPGDFESIVVSTNDGTPIDVTTLCVQGANPYTVVLDYPVVTWTAEQVDTNEITVTFAQNAVGTYTLTCQIMVPPT